MMQQIEKRSSELLIARSKRVLINIKKRINNIEGIFGILIVAIAATFTINPVQAETGRGEDIFKVILTIFEADKSKGDVIAIVTANNGEASRVKFLETELSPKSPNSTTTLTPATTSHATNGGIMEYVATFPNVTVNAGTEYKACLVTTKSLDLTCTTGNNSPAARPEFVDISLNATGGAEESVTEDESEQDE
jgi:hypothetical protein